MPAADPAFEPLVQLSRKLLRQQADFGLFSIGHDPLKRAAVSGFLARLDLVLFLLEAFEETADCGLSAIYNLSDWSDETPIAHSPPLECAILSKRISQSLYETWALDWQSEQRPSAYRFVRGALYLWHRDGVDAAVSFLFGLATSGFMTHRESLLDCLELLDRAVATDDNDFIASLYGGSVPPDHHGWRTQKPLWPEAAPNGLGASGRALLESLAGKAIDFTEEARGADTYDQWFRAQFSLLIILTGVVGFLRNHAKRLDAVWRTAADQLEEILADAFAVMRASNRNAHGTLTAPWATISAAVAGAIERAAGAGWRDRFIEERALLPRRFAATVLGPDGDAEPFSNAKLAALPDEVMLLSPAVGRALVAAHGHSTSTLSIAREAAASGGSNAKTDLAALNQADALITIGHPELALDTMTTAIAAHPWSAGHYFKRAETFMALGKAREARSDVEAALLVEPCVPVFWALYAQVLEALDWTQSAAFARIVALRLRG